MSRKSQPPRSVPSAPRLTAAVWLALILVVTAAAYAPALRCGWTNWDDDVYVTANPAVLHWSLSETLGFFTGFHSGNYHPLTMLSLALNARFGGPGAFGFHLVNVLLHLANTALVFWLILLLFADLRIAVPASVLFGVHTLHVESVAWVSERKDVLYALFFLASLIAYVKARTLSEFHGPAGSREGAVGGHPEPASEPGKFSPARRASNRSTASGPTGTPSRNEGGISVGHLMLALGLFLLSLLSKGQAVTLAPTLLLIDWLRGRDWRSPRALAEKAPFFLLALIFGVVAIAAQRSAAAIFDHASSSFVDRILFACYGFTQYLVKLTLPVRLSALYPYPARVGGSLPGWLWLYPVAVAAFAGAALFALRRSRPVFFGLAFFVVNIALVLQLLPVGNAIMADRYSYLPSIGLFVLAGLVCARWPSPLTWVSCAAYVLLLAALTMSRCRVWTDSLSLWQDTVETSPGSETAWSSLGSALEEEGRYAEARDDYGRAVAINPGFAKAWSNRARCRLKLGETDAALADAGEALKLRPDLAYSHTTLGVVQLARNDTAAAAVSFARALELDPADAQAYGGRAAVRMNAHDRAGALADLDTAIRLAPASADLYSNRGIVRAESGDTQGALSDFSTTIALLPRQPGGYLNRAVLYLKLSNRSAACEDLRRAGALGARIPDATLNSACSP